MTLLKHIVLVDAHLHIDAVADVAERTSAAREDIFDPLPPQESLPSKVGGGFVC
jgi:hypothetical protein